MLIDKKIILPHWLAYPEIPAGSIGWRMGGGEWYLMKSSEWYDNLDEDEKIEYQKLFPVPLTRSWHWDKKENFGGYKGGGNYMPYWRHEGLPKYTKEEIINEYNNGKEMEFIKFWGHRPSANGKITKSCFSQWWMCDFRYHMNNFCCTEQFMMAYKAEFFSDKESFEKIMSTNDPKAIKLLGRKVQNFDQIVWDKIKYSIVLNGTYMKFIKNPELMKFLLSTGDNIIVEASPQDDIWGIGMAEDYDGVDNPNMWKGENLLGFALMEVRDEIRRVWGNVHLGVLYSS